MVYSVRRHRAREEHRGDAGHLPYADVIYSADLISLRQPIRSTLPERERLYCSTSTMSSTSSGENSSVSSLAIHFADSTILWTEFKLAERRHTVVCDLCGQTITLNEKADSRPIVLHRGSKSCHKKARRVEREQEQERISTIRESIGDRSAPRTPLAAAAASTRPSVAPVFRQLHLFDSTATASPLSSTPVSSQNSPLSSTTPLVNCSAAPSPGPSSAQWTTPYPTPSHGGEHDWHGHGDESDVQELCSSIAGMPSNLTPARPPKCRGVLVEWTPGSVWRTYPYHRHAQDADRLPWEPVVVENDRWLRICSEDCEGEADTDDEVCSTCASVPGTARFRAVMDRAVSASAHTPWKYLTREQLDRILRNNTGKYRQLRIKVRLISD